MQMSNKKNIYIYTYYMQVHRCKNYAQVHMYIKNVYKKPNIFYYVVIFRCVP